ncbi:MAG: hypothetical protein KKI08_24660 [Armatimonadetes bacterium]|nr:hypothetical protein [Armatimonadota bacterium]
MRAARRPWTRAIRLVLSAAFGALVAFGVFVAVDVAIAAHHLGSLPGQDQAVEVREYLLDMALIPLVMLVGAAVGVLVAWRTGRTTDHGM